MKRLHIAHLRASEFFGGPERAILGQATSMPQFDFTYFSFVRGGSHNRFLEEAGSRGLKTEQLRESSVADFRVIGQLRNLAGTNGIDLVVSHDYKSRFSGYLAFRKSAVGHIGHFRGTTLEDTKVRVYNWIDRLVMRRMENILTVSHKSASLLEQFGVSASAIKVIPNAIDQHKLLPESFRKEVATNRPVKIVAAGRLSHEKGYDILLDAVGLLVKGGHRNLHLSIYGHGPDELALKAQSERLDISKFVTFAGFIDDILPRLKEADLLILPSRSEGMPNVILEAWSQKLGVVSTKVGGVPEMIEHGVSGLLADPDSPDRLAEQLSRAISNREEMVRFGEAGYELVQSKYSYEKQAELLGDIYQDAVNRRG